jgi:hypothetical protein
MPRAWSIRPGYRAQSTNLDPDWGMARLAERQHGVISRTQLLGLGLTSSAIERRRAAARLHLKHRGVYAVGQATITRHGAWMAAVLACGPDAVLSHRSAAALHDLRADNRVTTDVTSPVGGGRNRPGILAHRSPLEPRETSTVRAIPCTSVERTLLDLAGEVDPRSLERAIERAEILRVLDWRELRRTADKAGPRPGVAALRAAVRATAVAPPPTRSELEHLFLELCRRAGLQRPSVNCLIELTDGRLEADFHWRQARLIVEVDGWETHGTRAAFTRDRRRDQRLTVGGYRVVRFTWWQVIHEPELVTRTLRALLG